MKSDRFRLPARSLSIPIVKKISWLRPAVVLLLLFLPLHVFAQTEQQKVETIILHQDALFWDVYNRCDNDAFAQFFTEDVEFYHDKGGLTLGRESLVASLKKNLCSNENFRLRREPVEGTVKVYTLQKDNVTYGAVISGEHYFYVLEKGKKERRDGLAKFFHVWILKDGAWKMSRVVSYDHGPAPYINTRKETKLTPEVLKQYVGSYTGEKSGPMNVQQDQGFLLLVINDKKYSLYPETENQFFSKDRDLTFEFVKNDKNQVSKMVVRENGEVVETAEAAK